MTQTRRHFLTTTAAAISITTILPYAARAASHSNDVFMTNAGDVKVHPVSHASFVMETSIGTIYCDPVGDVTSYAGFPRPDLILITHHHGDHYKPETLTGLVGDKTQIITNPTVFDELPDNLKSKSSQIANGEATVFNGLNIDDLL